MPLAIWPPATLVPAIRMAATTPLNDTMASTDRSMPPVRMTNVCPAATTPMAAASSAEQHDAGRRAKGRRGDPEDDAQDQEHDQRPGTARSARLRWTACASVALSSWSPVCAHHAHAFVRQPAVRAGCRPVAVASSMMRLFRRPRPRVRKPRTRPPPMTMIRSLMPRISGSSELIIRMATPCSRQLVDHFVDLDLGAHVDAAGRFVEDQHLRARWPAICSAPPSAVCRPTG